MEFYKASLPNSNKTGHNSSLISPKEDVEILYKSFQKKLKMFERKGLEIVIMRKHIYLILENFDCSFLI